MKTSAYVRSPETLCSVSELVGASGFMVLRLPTPAVVVLEAAEAEVAAAPSAAVVVVGIGLLKASKNAGVPKVSVRAMARTCQGVSS